MMLQLLRGKRGLPREEYTVFKLCRRWKTKEGVEDARDMARNMHISEVNEWPPDHMGCHGTYQKTGCELGTMRKCSIDIL